MPALLFVYSRSGIRTHALYLIWEFEVICCSKASSLGVEAW